MPNHSSDHSYAATPHLSSVVSDYYGVHFSDDEDDHSHITVSPEPCSRIFIGSIRYIAFEAEPISYLPSPSSGVTSILPYWTMNIVPSLLVDVTHIAFRTTAWLRAERAAVRSFHYDVNYDRPNAITITDDYAHTSDSPADCLRIHRQVLIRRCHTSHTTLRPCGIMGSATHGALEACRTYRIALAAGTITPRPIVITPMLIRFLHARLCMGPDLSTHLVRHTSGDHITISQIRYAHELICRLASIGYSVTSALGQNDHGTALFDYYIYTPDRTIGRANNR